MITLNVSLHPITFASSTRSLRLSGTSIIKPIIAIVQNVFALANGVISVTIGCGVTMCRNMNTSISMWMSNEMELKKREECCAPACRAAVTIALPISNMMSGGIVHAQNPNSTIHSICMSCLLVANERMIAHGSVRLNTSPCATR